MPFKELADRTEAGQQIIECAGETFASAVGVVVQNLFAGKKLKENVINGILVGGMKNILKLIKSIQI